MDGKSLDILSEKISKLKELYPEAFTENKIDWEKLKATLGDDLNFSQERYHLNWAGKSEVFRVLQQRTSATLIPVPEESYPVQSSFCHSEPDLSGEESQNKKRDSSVVSLPQNDNENIFIEGENLEVLKVLQKSYFGKIKMIYIDPPYNTGSDSFIYPDRFAESKDEYLKRIGDKDEEGFLLKEGMFRKNSKDSGHYHSNWLSMMYPRLYLARNLLRDDGVIFVSIDDNEVHNLRMIMNEIFGEENFVSSIVWKKRVSPANDSKWFSSDHEYLIIYAKNKDLWFPNRVVRTEAHNSYYKNPDDDPRGPWNSAAYTCNKSKEERQNLYYPILNPNTGEEIWPRETAVWAYSKETHEKHVSENLLWWGNDGKSKSPRKKQFLSDAENVVPRSFLDFKEGGSTQKATLDFLSIFEFNYFQYPKPIQLLKKVLEYGTTGQSNDIILDFFAGSGTTAQAVLELNKEDGGNRKFILVQLPEKTDENSEAYKAGYKTIADICKERIRRVIKKLGNGYSETEHSEGEESKKPNLFDKDSSSQQVETHNGINSSLGFNVFKLAPSNFKIWRSDVIENEQDLEKMIDIFDDKVKPNSEKENMFYELILKSGYQLTVETLHATSQSGNYYVINKNETIILLEAIDQAIIDEILKLQPKNVISLDKLFAGNDQLKTNTALQMKDANIEFRTV